MIRHPSLYQINTRVRLRELSERWRRPATLADIPDDFLDQVVSLGFDYVWFLGLWQTGAAGRQVSLSHPEWMLQTDNFRDLFLFLASAKATPILAFSSSVYWARRGPWWSPTIEVNLV